MSDPYFSSVVLLTHLDGVNGATTATDVSTNTKTLTFNGTAQLSTSGPMFGTASALFDQSSGCYIGVSNDPDFTIGSNDFTFECWVNLSDYSNSPRILLMATAFSDVVQMWFKPDGSLNGETNDTNDFGGGFLPLNSWRHCAMTRLGSLCTLWLDGNSVATSTDARAMSAPITVVIAGYQSHAFVPAGKIDEVRITNGVCRYTSNFVPAGPFPDSGSPPVPDVTVTAPTNPPFVPREPNKLILTLISNTKTGPYFGTVRAPLFCRHTFSGMDTLLVSNSPGTSPLIGGYNVMDLKKPVSLWTPFAVNGARGADFCVGIFTNGNYVYFVTNKSIEIFHSAGAGLLVDTGTFIDLTTFQVKDVVTDSTSLYLLLNDGTTSFVKKYDLSTPSMPSLVSTLDLLTNTSGSQLMAINLVDKKLVIQDIQKSDGWGYT